MAGNRGERVTMADYCIINASPRVKGRSTDIVESLLGALGDATIDQIDIGITPVSACTACDQCARDSVCPIKDEMGTHCRTLDEASTLIVVAPVYFAGPPSQLKAFFDRLQPYYWQYKRDQEKRPAEKRNAYLFVVREGGDPHGFEPLEVIARSALAVAGFKVQETFDYLGVYDDALREATANAAGMIAGS